MKEGYSFYTDESMTDHGVMAAAISEFDQSTAYLRPQDAQTAYAAELRGIEMALSQMTNNAPRKVVIFTNNQASIQTCP
jgi:ribonuclease HI